MLSRPLSGCFAASRISKQVRIGIRYTHATIDQSINNHNWCDKSIKNADEKRKKTAPRASLVTTFSVRTRTRREEVSKELNKHDAIMFDIIQEDWKAIVHSTRSNSIGRRERILNIYDSFVLALGWTRLSLACNSVSFSSPPEMAVKEIFIPIPFLRARESSASSGNSEANIYRFVSNFPPNTIGIRSFQGWPWLGWGCEIKLRLEASSRLCRLFLCL